MKNNQNLDMNFSSKDINDSREVAPTLRVLAAFPGNLSTHISKVIPPITLAPRDPTPHYEFHGYQTLCARHRDTHIYTQIKMN